MLPNFYKKIESLEALAKKAAERIKELEAENRRLSGECELLAAEQKRSQAAISRFRVFTDHHEKLRKRLARLRDKLVKLENASIPQN